MKGVMLTAILLLAVIVVIASSNLSYAMENTGNFTTPNITLVNYVHGRVQIRANWTSFGIATFTMKLYSGLSPYCLEDTNFVVQSYGTSLPYPGGPNSPVPTSGFLRSNAVLNVNQTGTIDYVCVVVNDSGGFTKNSTTTLVDISLIPSTTTSTTSISTTSLPTTSTPSTSTSSVYTTTVSSTSYSTTISPNANIISPVAVSSSLGVPHVAISATHLQTGQAFSIAASWSGGTAPYRASVAESPSPSYCGLSKLLYNVTIYPSANPSLSYSFVPTTLGAGYYCVYVSDSAGHSSASIIYIVNVSSTNPTSASNGMSCGCVCSGTCVRPAANIIATSNTATISATLTTTVSVNPTTTISATPNPTTVSATPIIISSTTSIPFTRIDQITTQIRSILRWLFRL